MKKLKIYIDTSVISNLHADDAPAQMEDSLKLWEEIKLGLYDIIISQLVLYEVRRCHEPKLSVLSNYLNEVEYDEIEIDEDIALLAQRYIDAGIIPIKYREDALHIAAATINNCNAIVSWNFKHMVKLKTIIGVNGINRGMGYGEIEIVTPMFLVGGEEEG